MSELSIADHFANTTNVEADINNVVELYESEMIAYVVIDKHEERMPVRADTFTTGCAVLFKDLSYVEIIQEVASAAESPTKRRTYIRTADAYGEFQSAEEWFQAFERCSTGASAALAMLRAEEQNAPRKVKQAKKSRVH
jgi:hypothetical protein